MEMELGNYHDGLITYSEESEPHLLHSFRHKSLLYVIMNIESYVLPTSNVMIIYEIDFIITIWIFVKCISGIR